MAFTGSDLRVSGDRACEPKKPARRTGDCSQSGSRGLTYGHLSKPARRGRPHTAASRLRGRSEIGAIAGGGRLRRLALQDFGMALVRVLLGGPFDLVGLVRWVMGIIIGLLGDTKQTY